MTANRLIIGLTGGIASGKTQVSQYFTALGVEVIDSDKIAKDLFKPNSPYLEKLRAKFSDGIFFSNQELDRKALGKIVFANKILLEWLNNFTHPLIYSEMKAQLSRSQSAYVVLDIPLLVNDKGDIPDHLRSVIDRVLVINSELETQINRLFKRDKMSRKEALNIINSQSSIQQKLALADDVIDNNGSLQELKHQVAQLHNQYLKFC